MKHELPPLPYDLDALTPFISKETLEFHHGKHHKAYVDTLNQLIEGTSLQNASLEELVMFSGAKVFNNAAQVWNHTFYWHCMRPSKGRDTQATPNIGGSLGDAMKRDFHSPDKFKEHFAKACTTQFGSGWAWLCRDTEGKLSIEQTANAENPMRNGKIPLLVCDVWEHAYYVDYRNARAKYVDAFWNLINWEFVQKNYEQHKDLPAKGIRPV